jgi:hypothetical protein
VRFYAVPARLKLPHVALALFVTRGLDQVACSQCLRGRVVLEAYSVGKALHDAGVVRHAVSCAGRVALFTFLHAHALCTGLRFASDAAPHPSDLCAGHDVRGGGHEDGVPPVP